VSAGPLLLAGDGKAFPEDLLDEAARLARVHHVPVSVMQLLRIWGSGLGIPHPGLLPNAEEKEAALETVRRATAYLERRGVPLAGHRITATRRPTRAILREAERVGAARIVMARVPKGPLRPEIATDHGRVLRSAHVPVDLVDVKRVAVRGA
jgi:nucleotide-binding universal stress UspA family protein